MTSSGGGALNQFMDMVSVALLGEGCSDLWTSGLDQGGLQMQAPFRSTEPEAALVQSGRMPMRLREDLKRALLSPSSGAQGVFQCDEASQAVGQ